MKFEKHTLKNGLRIVLVPQKNVLSATVLVLVKTGSKYETKNISGISHFLEHLLFKGTKKRPNAISIAEPLDRVGGQYNAFTGEEYTGYYAKVDEKNFDLALDIISDIYMNSKLDLKEVERERGVIIEEINMYHDHPTYYVQNLWTKLLYGDQPAGWDIAGTKETVQGIKREDIKKYLEKQYVASNTVVCLAGNFNNSNIKNKVEKYFSKIRNTSPSEKIQVVENQDSPQTLVHYRKTDQTHFCLGARGYNFFDQRKYQMEVLSVLLGGMMSSRLFVKVRERLGLAYYIRTETSFESDTGFLVTRAGVRNDKAKKAIGVILKEYRDISRKKITKEELSKVKDHLKGKMALSLELSDSRASFFGLQELLKKEILTPREIYDKIDKVKEEDVLNVAKDIFKPEKLNLALIGPFKEKDSFSKIWKKENY
ncbi:MAG: pitrilysin family protein [Candidatus Pacebacteria bacterium]|nr:pitrilysin family protein [Candidatus Paceibacterota bacterium]MDD3729230.1 pitrilysin family protein [Candidatus Paceibacterota bacterium]MDD4201700.1 pitrilysin family protein [Candidatus Paceibacterota bacterium]MDD5446002.1 pitrilysin family protein [Candidatus Paceibacterota bacterium]